MRTALTIAGSDSCGGAGIQADIKTMTMYGVYAMSAITALTAQNSMGVQSVMEVTPRFLAEQLDAIFSDIRPDAVKIGMLPTAALVRAVVDKLRQYRAEHIVIDPVMVSTSGTRLMEEDAIMIATEELFPLAQLITPNIPETEVLSGMTIRTAADMEQASGLLAGRYHCAVLCKGGHRTQDANDLLHFGEDFVWIFGNRRKCLNTHGTGCTLSSAIASGLALGFPLEEAVCKAKEYLSGALDADPRLGKGNGPLNHAYILHE